MVPVVVEVTEAPCAVAVARRALLARLALKVASRPVVLGWPGVCRLDGRGQNQWLRRRVAGAERMFFIVFMLNHR